MAKAKPDFQMTPLEVAQVGTERLQDEHPWALAVAQTVIQNTFSENYLKNKDNAFTMEKLKYGIAQQIVHARKGTS